MPVIYILYIFFFSFDNIVRRKRKPSRTAQTLKDIKWYHLDILSECRLNETDADIKDDLTNLKTKEGTDNMNNKRLIGTLVWTDE